MNRDGRSSSNDPTGEATADPAVQFPADGTPARRRTDDDVVNRDTADPTPRRYDRPVTDDDPVMPADDASLNTKI